MQRVKRLEAMKVSVVWLCMTLLFSIGVEAEPTKSSEFISTIYKLDPVIYDVKGMGNWKKGRQAGQVRLVITRTHRRDDVFLQWIQYL